MMAFIDTLPQDDDFPRAPIRTAEALATETPAPANRIQPPLRRIRAGTATSPPR